MRKIFGLLSLLITYSATAQEIVLPGTAYSSNYGENLAIGNVTPSIDLFTVETPNPDFQLSAKLTYNPFVYFAEDEYDNKMKSYFDKGWETNIIPSITKWVGPRGVDDEVYYSNPYVKDCRGTIGERARYEFNIFGLEGKFIFKEEDGEMKVIPYYTSDYMDIEADYEFSTAPGQEIFQINSFTVTDKNGYQYIFSEKQQTWYEYYRAPRTWPLEPAPACIETFLTNRSFLLSQVKDKYGKLLLNYNYASFPDEIEIRNQDYEYDQKYLSAIAIPGLSVIDFIMDVDKKRYSSVRISKQGYQSTYTPQRYIDFNFSNYNSSKDIIFRNQNLEIDYEYKVYLGWLPVAMEVTSPLKGITRYEFEKNDYAFKEEYPEEFTFYEEEELPVTDLSTSNYSRYSFHCPDEYLNSDDEIYISYTTYQEPGMLDPGGNPVIAPPLPLRLYTSNNTFLTEFGGPEQEIPISNILNAYKSYFPNNVFYVGRIPGGSAKILNVKVIRKYESSDPTLVKKKPFKGYRISKIINKDSNGNIISQKNFTYRMKDDPYRSSGTIPFMHGRLVDPSLYDYMLHYLYYRYVTVEETGKGKITYDFQGTPMGITNHFYRLYNLSSMPKGVYKYNDEGELLSSEVHEFELYNNNNYESTSIEGLPLQMLKKLTTTATVYVPGSTTKKLTTITESSFDTITRHLTHRKITDVRLAQTFEEEHQYQKLGNAYYRTAVKKYKNGTMINQSKAEYAPINNGTLANVYALEKSAVAKATQPFETEKEITKRDNKGNILEYKTKEGLYVSQIWGYNDTKVVAELKNQRYAQIASGTIATIKNNSKSTSYNETGLVTALNGLRTTYPNAYITTYTYIPMVGLKTTTDANGRKETYQYDDFNRLYRVLNHEGNVVKEYNYNIKN